MKIESDGQGRRQGTGSRICWQRCPNLLGLMQLLLSMDGLRESRLPAPDSHDTLMAGPWRRQPGRAQSGLPQLQLRGSADAWAIFC